MINAKFKLLTAIVIYSILSFPTPSHAQYYNQQSDFLKANSIWIYNWNGGLAFNSGSAMPFNVNFPPNTINFWESGVSVADPITGTLLFHSDGLSIANSNLQLMPNGNRSLFPSTSSVASTQQGICAVPVIDSPGKYYIFSLWGTTNGPNPNNGYLYYSVVDMNLMGGLGDVTAGPILVDTNRLVLHSHS
jgi:hypothetical protein